MDRVSLAIGIIIYLVGLFYVQSMIIGGNGYFVLRAEAEAEGRPPKTIWIIDPLVS